MIKTILWDLDGTLLPMNQPAYIQEYIQLLAEKNAPLGFEQERLQKAIWHSIVAMIKNTGSKVNERLFWDTMVNELGDRALVIADHLQDFYQNEYPKVKKHCGFNPMSAEIIAYLKKQNLQLVLATSPLYPPIATESRIEWAGLNSNDFDLITNYENCSHSKPNPDYFQEVLDKLSLRPEECLMIGNDMDEDLAAASIGIPVFMVTDFLLNPNQKDVTAYDHGTLAELFDYLKTSFPETESC